MWISLTTTRQKRTLVNFNAVLHMNEHSTGTQIVFDAKTDKGDGGKIPMVLYVQESIASIGKILKSRTPRY